MGQQGLHLPGQPGTVVGVGGGADLAHQPRQGVQSQPALGVQPVPVPVRVLHQVLRPLEQQGKHVVEVLPPLPVGENGGAGVPQLLEALGHLVELGPDLLPRLPLRQPLQNAGQLLHALVHLGPGVGGGVAAGVQGQGGQGDESTQNNGKKLRPEVRGTYRPQLQKHKGHGKDKVPLGGKLAALKHHQQKGHGKVEQHAKRRSPGGQVGQQAQHHRHRKHLPVIHSGQAPAAAQVEQGGGAGDNNGVPGAEEEHYGEEEERIHPDGGQGVPQAAPKPGHISAHPGPHLRPSSPLPSVASLPYNPGKRLFKPRPACSARPRRCTGRE